MSGVGFQSLRFALSNLDQILREKFSFSSFGCQMGKFHTRVLTIFHGCSSH